MKTITKKTVEINLTLSEEDAIWLMSLVQNPIGYDDPYDEPIEYARKRELLFGVLKEGLEE